jgi:hypothetical protein
MVRFWFPKYTMAADAGTATLAAAHAARCTPTRVRRFIDLSSARRILEVKGAWSLQGPRAIPT